ncbi:BAG domain-containing protein Samui [Toxorhynchites rutilus septentrionalis]|uniref:BAG domain-containing protein Samui n=1 Tax=Toxorhynchites rutilus septentrionalis TaxID=329112 RepID=UPI00247B1307|nr:BAG domain-containing protein Samui [Toxorhynchites rutilus septentrionalis]
MSQQEQPQPTVRHIPIFVEGRSEPLVNKIPESQPSNNSSSSSIPEQPRMEMPSHNTSDFFKHGSIFDRTRDFPVRTFPNSTFFSKTNPAREPSPAKASTVFTDSGFPTAAATTTTMPSQQQQARGSSQPRQSPSPPTAAQQQQQYQQQQAQKYQQYQQEQTAKQQAPAHDQPDSKPKAAPAANDPISKIQKIQRDVLDIFDQVERFQGGKDGKRDKTYMYLDEMLTQNLLKLDSIDAGDQPQIKSARREAIKSINHCIAVLEAKAEAGAVAADESTSISESTSRDKMPNGTTEKTGSGASLSRSSSNSSSQQQHQQQSQ